MTRSALHSRSRRGGAALAVALVALVVLGIMLGVLLRLGVSRRRQARAEERRVQAEWLAESGLERAWARLAESPDYEGETWGLSADDLGAPGKSGADAAVTIEVRPVEGATRRRSVRVVAVNPRQSETGARHTKTLVFDL